MDTNPADVPESSSRAALRHVFATTARASVLAVLIDASPHALRSGRIAELVMYNDGLARSTVHTHLDALVEDTPLVEKIDRRSGYTKYRLADNEHGRRLRALEDALIASFASREEHAQAVDEFNR